MEIAIKDRDGKEYLSYAKTFKVCTDGHELLIYEAEDNEIAICEIGKRAESWSAPVRTTQSTWPEKTRLCPTVNRKKKK